MFPLLPHDAGAGVQSHVPSAVSGSAFTQKALQLSNGPAAIYVVNTDAGYGMPELLDLSEAVEGLGYDSAWVGDSLFSKIG